MDLLLCKLFVLSIASLVNYTAGYKSQSAESEEVTSGKGLNKTDLCINNIVFISTTGTCQTKTVAGALSTC